MMSYTTIVYESGDGATTEEIGEEDLLSQDRTTGYWEITYDADQAPTVLKSKLIPPERVYHILKEEDNAVVEDDGR